MADNSDNEELINLGAEVDDASLDDAASKMDALNQPINAIQQNMETLAQQAAATETAMNEAFENMAKDAEEFAARSFPDTDILDAIEKRIELEKIASDALQVELDYANQLNAVEEERIAKAQEWADIIQANNQQATGYGQSGGMIGPAEDDGSGGSGSSGGGSGGRGGLSAIGRGFMTAGRQFKSPGLSAVGSSLYEVQGISQLGKLTEGIEGLGTAAAIAAPLLVIGGIAYESYTSTLKEANDALNNAIQTNDAYYKAIQGGSSSSIQAQLEKAQQEYAVNQQTQINDSNALLGTQKQLTDSYGPLGQALFNVVTVTGFGTDAMKNLDVEFSKAYDSAGALGDRVKGLEHALDFANNISAIQEANSLEQERFKLIQTGTAQGVQAQIDANTESYNANLQSIQYFEALKATLTDKAEIAVVQAQIDSYIDKNKQLADTYTMLTGDVESIIKLHEETNRQYNIFLSNVDATNQMQVQHTQLMRTGTTKQVEDEEQGLQDRIAANKTSMATLKSGLAQYIKEHQDLMTDADKAEIAQTQSKIDQLDTTNKQLQKSYDDLVDHVAPVVSANDELKTSLKDVGTIATDASAAFAKVGELRQKHDDAESKADADWQDAQSKADDAFNLKRQQEITVFNNKLTQDDKKNNEKWANETDKVYADYNAAQQKQDETILKYQTDESTKITQINADLADKQTQIASDLAAKISDIQEKAHADELDAASNLDARKIAQLQRKEAQDITNAESAAKKQEDTATKAAEKQKAQLEKDTETKIEDLKKQDEAERDQRLADGLAKIQEEKDNYAAERQNQIDNFDQKLTDEDQQRQRETDARYADYQNKKTALDMQFTDAMKQLNDHFTIQSSAADTHYKNLSSIQTTGQTNIETAWGGMLDKLQSAVVTIGTPTSYTQPAPVNTSNTKTYAPGETAAYANYNSGFEDFAGYTGTTGDVGLATGGYVDTSTNLSAENKNNNYGNFADYHGFASGGDPTPGDDVWVGEHGPELARFKDPVHIYDNASSMGGGANNGGSTTHNGGHSFTYNGQDMSKLQFLRLLEQSINELTD